MTSTLALYAFGRPSWIDGDQQESNRARVGSEATSKVALQTADPSFTSGSPSHELLEWPRSVLVLRVEAMFTDPSVEREDPAGLFQGEVIGR
jgi:hypothetical protein